MQILTQKLEPPGAPSALKPLVRATPPPSPPPHAALPVPLVVGAAVEGGDEDIVIATAVAADAGVLTCADVC